MTRMAMSPVYYRARVSIAQPDDKTPADDGPPSLEFPRIVIPGDDEKRSGETVTAKSLSLVVKSIIRSP